MRFRHKALLTIALSLFITVQPVLSQSSTSTPSTTATTGQVEPVEPAVTEEEANAQALADTPPPQQVFDLANAGIVYGLLSEGVAAWLAELGGNTDEWGNERSSVYVSATRPDVVPASLQTFLLAYYKDNPTIGLAYGPEGIKEAETDLDQRYNEAVADRTDQIYQDAVDEAQSETDELQQQQDEEAANQTEPDVNDSEDVPGLDDNNDNGESTPAEDTTSSTITVASISPSDFNLKATLQILNIIGEGFGTDPGALTVDFSNGFTGVVPDSVYDTSLAVTMPEDFSAATNISVTVNKGDETSAGVTISAKATISSISVPEITNGEILTILGYGFDSETLGNNSIVFEATTDGKENITISADKADFLSQSLKCQLTITSMVVTAETTGSYNIKVLTNDIPCVGTIPIIFTLP